MLNNAVRLHQIHDMLIFRHYNVFMTPEKDTIIVAPPKNSCYIAIGCIENGYYSINLIRCATGDILKTDIDKYQPNIITTVEKLLKYSELILECRKTPMSSGGHLYVSVTGQEDEVILSIMMDSDELGPYAIKVLPVTFTGNTYVVGYCKTDYAEYESVYELIHEFIKGAK